MTILIIVFVLIGIQRLIKYTTNELDRPYRIIKRSYYDVGKLKTSSYIVQKKVNLLGFRYWTGVACEDGYDSKNVPYFDNFDEAYELLKKCKQQRPLNGIKDEVEVEWNKYPMKIN